MKVIESSLYHRVLPPEQSKATRHPTLIILHGRGADEEDLLGLASSLGKHLLILSVRAPYSFPYSGGYTWYDVGEVGAPEALTFRTSYEKLRTFVDDAMKHYPVDPHQIFLLGFSMGTVMSYALSLTLPHLFRGVMANSGYIPEGTYLSFEWHDLLSLEFFVVHGIHDPIIPVQFGRRAKELLGQAGARFSYKEYPMGHEISMDSHADMSEWLHQRITDPTQPGGTNKS
jgi:phospholipase/carboxylesterase